jgi:hypothetical protein
VILDDTPETPDTPADPRRALFISGTNQLSNLPRARTAAETARQQSMNATRRPSATVVRGPVIQKFSVIVQVLLVRYELTYLNGFDQKMFNESNLICKYLFIL